MGTVIQRGSGDVSGTVVVGGSAEDAGGTVVVADSADAGGDYLAALRAQGRDASGCGKRRAENCVTLLACF